MRPWLAGVVLPLLGVVGVAADGAFDLPFDLRGAAQYAFLNAPSCQAARLQVQIAELNLKNQRVQSLPTLDLTSIHGAQDPVGDFASAQPVGTLQLSLSENLYDNGRQLNLTRQAQVNLDRLRLEQTRLCDQAVLAVAQAFLDASVAHENFKIQTQQLDVLRQQNERVALYYRQGLKTRRDYLRLQAQVLRGQSQIEQLKSEITAREAELIRAMGWPRETSQTPVFQWQDLTSRPNLDSSSARGQERLLSERTGELQKQIASLDVQLARREYGPRLYATAQGEYRSENYLDQDRLPGDEGGFGWNALLTVKLNLWDWGVLRRNVAIAKSTQMVTETTIRDEILRDQAELVSLKAQLAADRESLRMALELVDLEQRAFDVLQTDYRQGAASFLDLITALGNLASAKLTQVTTAASFLKSQYSEKALRGTLYETTFQ